MPMGFCFPGYDAKGSDLPPRKECAPLWRARVLAAMPQVRLVLAVGGYAQAYHLGALARGGMTETVRNFRVFLDPPEGPSILPLPHPSWRNTGWIRRNPWFEEALLPELFARVHALIR
ncbi:uracil-DNA glycosylase [Gellertiella hungarica]|uniref:Uracil-DNA glycosylase n=1 Tax=Gellertiella hungarica TaxID=1572859 RepID=A0A7W6J5Y3_9HYPH|nr:uracil-DNA glycosylase [Gellertiella hungarica]